MAPRSWYIPSGEAVCTTLNGAWKFAFFADGDISDEINFTDTIDVPSCWQARGYENPNYSNINYPYPFDMPYVPDINPVGVYEREFTVNNTNRKTYIVFEGVSSCAKLFINGKYVGFTQGSRLEAEFDISNFVTEGENTVSVQTKACTKYIDINNTASGYASFALDTVAIYGDFMLDDSDTIEISETDREYLHNFTSKDQSAINNNNPPEGRYSLTYYDSTATSGNIKKVLPYAYGNDYLTHFYGGAAVSVNFTSTVEGKATVTFKVSSGYITKMQNYSLYETGDMIVNKIMKITANGNEVVFGDDVVLKGDKTKQDYSCMGMWTEISFEMDITIGENTIVLTSLYPVDESGNTIYNDPGKTGTQSAFNLDTVTVTLN